MWESSGILVVVLKAKSESNFFTEKKSRKSGNNILLNNK